MKGPTTRTLTLLATGLFILAYYPIFRILAIKWADSEDYAHAFFVVPIILYMAWLKRESLMAREGGKISGLICMVAATTVYMVSLKLYIPTFIALAMVLMVTGVILGFFGFRSLVDMSIPLLLLLMLIPIPDQLLAILTSSLQLRVSEASEQILRLVNIPIFREGNVLHSPEKTFQVVQACSGIRSLISLITLSLILGYFTLRSGLSRGTLIVLSIPVAVIINILRVVALVMAFHYLQWDLSLGIKHTLLGLVLFCFALLILFFLQRILERWETKKTTN